MYVRTRLTLWFVLILALMLAAFGYTIYELTRESLLAEVKRDVQQRATELAAVARPAPGQFVLHIPPLDVFKAPDTYVQLVNSSGRVLARSANLGRRSLPVPPGGLREARLSGVPLVVCAFPVRLGSHVLGYAVVARTPRTIYQAVGRLRSILYDGVPVALLLAAGAAWLLTRRALRPLERLSGSATAIAAAQDHTRRVRLEGPSDEIRRLAQTINGMLQALQGAYQQEQAALQQVQEVNDLQRQFLADISHELRTPLTIMLSSLDLVARVGASDAEFQARALADMRVEAERMARLVTQLLILARADAGATVTPVPLLVADVVAEACRQARPVGCATALDGRGLGLLNGAVVHGNPDDLKQLWLILLDNAFKYTPADGRVEVTATLQPETVAVTVADNGIGIAAHDLPRVFERFYRAENARAKAGMGLGLAIARRIADQHGGTIAVQSAPGQGSRFTVTLPLLNGAGAPDGEDEGPRPGSVQETLLPG
jgi:signal transduction histidine kinase